MDFVVCSYDQERVKNVDGLLGPGERPLVDCPRCGRRYVFTEDGELVSYSS
ncbi:hypothetical protein [Kineococcus radiotolerans]|uniref:hypothetical protein n=1 Tax=Kineococcus radiotolerans TaxID=131568 RepID=UPI00003A3CCF|nr:hypothetical protein [Kineococcus radiotolerans]